VKHIAELTGRVLLSFIFLFEAYDSVFFFKETKLKMEFYGISWNQDMLLYGAIAFLILGGIMVLLGYRASLGAFLLLIYWIPVTFIVHDFWNVPYSCNMHINCTELNIETEELYRRLEAVLFMKNLAILGGLLMILVNGSGKYSIRRLFATTKVPGV
jgi:putative oxidoreductase